MNLKDKLHKVVFTEVTEEEKLRLPITCKNEIHGICQAPHSSCQMCAQDLKQHKEPSYLLTPLELLEFKKKWASEGFEAGQKYGFYDAHDANAGDIPDEETFINNLTID